MRAFSPRIRLMCRRQPKLQRNGHIQPFEEQTLSRYASKIYYPVRPGEVFNDRYRTIAKLGYGAYSTVWLARDEKTNAYTSIKIFNLHSTDPSPATNEINILKHLAQSCQTDHIGLLFVRLASDFFELDGPHGRHPCVVMKPESCSLWEIQHMFDHAKLPKQFVQDFTQRMYAAINWLHVDANVMHTGTSSFRRKDCKGEEALTSVRRALEITTQNVLMKADNDAMFQRLEEEEMQSPSQPLTVDEEPVYASRGELKTIFELSSEAVLTDFGSARILKAENKDWWMPDTYRAPEILMGVPWSVEVDNWSIGVMALELLEGKNLFSPIDTTARQYVLPLALAQYISYLGPPPLWMIQQSANPVIKTFFDEQGRWISQPPIPETSLEEFVTAIPPGEEKQLFLDFIRSVLTWEPQARARSSDLFYHKWLAPPGVSPPD